jgi:hypothetical protein
MSSTPLTPEQRRAIIARMNETRELVRRGYRYRAAADDMPTIPVPPPSPDALRPARRPRPTPYQAPWDDRPTLPPPTRTNYPTGDE